MPFCRWRFQHRSRAHLAHRPPPAISSDAPSEPRILLVIPAYRESERLPPFLAELCTALEEAELPVIVRPVDDGSGSAEADILRKTIEELAPRHRVLSEGVFLDKNQGKGGAVYSGWDSADEEDFEWLAFVDADGAVSASETARLLGIAASQAAENRECLFAVRVGEGGTKVRRTFIRKILGQIFRFLVKITFGLPARDTQCGLKCVPSASYREVRPLLVERRFVFDVELAARLVRAGCSIREIPISWHESPGTRLHIVSAARMLSALIAVRWRLFFKRA